MGHIQLSRAADLLVVAPATANILAKMAAGLADDLASTVLLATDKPVLVAPAMNVRMWLHPATQANMATLIRRGIQVIQPNEGPMACNEFGPGRLAEPPEILAAIEKLLAPVSVPLAGRHALVTSGPTYEPIDPVPLYRQPLLRPAGPRHRDCAGPTGRPRDLDKRAGVRPRSSRRHGPPYRKRPRNARCVPGRIAGRHRSVRCRGRRLARGAGLYRQNQEAGRMPHRPA